MGWESRMDRARRLHRPKLRNWECDNMYEAFPAFLEKLRASYDDGDSSQQFFVDPEGTRPKMPRQVPAVLDADSLTRPDFFENYEAKEIPCVIRNIPAGYDGGEKTKPWKGLEQWQFENLWKTDEEYLDRGFKCGEDDDGHNIRVKLKHFLSYTEFNRDDSPLYVFDSNFDEDRIAKRLLGEYRVPSYFSEDLFGLVSESRRPPYRWWLIGPQRSGTCVHIDPLSTSAWNTLIVGEKRWVLFPPHVPKSVVKGNDLVRNDEDDEAIHYFMFILPRIKRKALSLRGSPKYKDFCCYEFTQQAGETVFIPNGWWHAVLNLTDTVAITQNFCSSRNFDKVWLKTRTGRKRMAWKWLCQLEEKYPHLAERAKAANERDQFAMKYDPSEMERQEEEERKAKEAKKHRKRVQLAEQQQRERLVNSPQARGKPISTPAYAEQKRQRRMDANNNKQHPYHNDDSRPRAISP